MNLLHLFLDPMASVDSGPEVTIVATPTGDAPEWVRDAWVGLTLSTDPRVPTCRSISVSHHYLDPNHPNKADENSGGYAVYVEYALYKLHMAGKSDAAWWWRRHRPYLLETWFIFGRQFCQEVESDVPSTNTETPPAQPS